MPCSRPDYSFAHVLLGTGDPGKLKRAHTEILAIRIMMAAGQFIRRPFEYQPLGKVLLRLQADGHDARTSQYW